MVFGIVISAAIVLIIALVAAVFQTSAVKGDDVCDTVKTEKILECLPGENCGACGYENCTAAARAIATGKAPCNACPAGGQTVAQVIGVLTGEDKTDNVRMRAQVMCSGGGSCTKKKYIYEDGAEDCLAAMKLGGGDKSCKSACVGLGNCKAACPFGAISIKDGVARVDHRLCKGCGICVSACPKHIIKLLPYDTYHWVGCVSHENRDKTLSSCQTGCTGCGECSRVCPENAISISHNCAEIDYARCSGCGMCYDVCPQGVVWRADAFGAEGLSIRKGIKH